MISFKGMHNTATVWTDNEKHELRNHYLGMHLREAHQLFCQLHPTEVDLPSPSQECPVDW